MLRYFDMKKCSLERIPSWVFSSIALSFWCMVSLVSHYLRNGSAAASCLESETLYSFRPVINSPATLRRSLVGLGMCQCKKLRFIKVWDFLTSWRFVSCSRYLILNLQFEEGGDTFLLDVGNHLQDHIYNGEVWYFFTVRTEFLSII